MLLLDQITQLFENFTAEVSLYPIYQSVCSIQLYFFIYCRPKRRARLSRRAFHADAFYTSLFDTVHVKKKTNKTKKITKRIYVKIIKRLDVGPPRLKEKGAPRSNTVFYRRDCRNACKIFLMTKRVKRDSVPKLVAILFFCLISNCRNKEWKNGRSHDNEKNLLDCYM